MHRTRTSGRNFLPHRGDTAAFERAGVRRWRLQFLPSLLVPLGLLGAPARAVGGDGVESAARAPSPLFESGPVRPLCLSPDGRTLFVAHTSDHRVEIFEVAGSRHGSLDQTTRTVPGNPQGEPFRSHGSIFTGLEPVALLLHPEDPSTLFVANHVSDTVSVVDLDSRSVRATIDAGDEPLGLAFADGKLFVACARAPVVPLAPGAVEPGEFVEHVVTVFDGAAPHARLAVIEVGGTMPRDLLALGDRVFVVPQNSGNHTTLLDERQAIELGLEQTTKDAFDPPFSVNPILTIPALNQGNLGRGWRVPPAGRIVFDHEYPDRVPQLPDEDLTEIDAVSLSKVGSAISGVGTTLFALAHDPVTGQLWVAGTQALNRTRFERFLRGRAVENWLSLVRPGVGVDRVLVLQPPIVPTAQAQPVAIAFDNGAAVPRAFVAMLGSDSVLVLDARNGRYLQRLPTASLPSGLAVDEERGFLYVWCRGDLVVERYRIEDPSVVAMDEAKLPYDPEPPVVHAGRKHLYSARADTGHGNGTTSCASCHVFGHHDFLGWDLGDPEGGLSYYYPDLLQGVASFGGAVVVDWFTPVLSPLKGPMVTQSLRGLFDPHTRDDAPLHWRGDRKVLQMFEPAFHDLLGGTGVDRTAMQELGVFLRELRYAPNPFQDEDRQYRGDAAVGADLFGMNRSFTGKDYGDLPGVSCITCHQGNFFDGSDHVGGRPVASAGAFQQLFDTAQLRGNYEKDHRSILGFGVLHDGAVDGARGFLDFVNPHTDQEVFPLLTPEDRDRIGEFARRWDPGLGPMVGAQHTARSDDAAQTAAFLSLAIAEAQKSSPPHLDLVLKGDRQDAAGHRLPRGAVYEFDPVLGRYGFRFDTGDFVDEATVRLLSRTGVARWTFTCVPPGTGRRLGIDRDEDGLFDAVERALGTDANDPDSDDDGFSDGLEVASGSDPRRWNATIPDSTPPAALDLVVSERGFDSATLTLIVDEPSTVELDLGSSPGLADLGPWRSERLRARHDLVLTDLPAATECFATLRAVDAMGNLATFATSFVTLPPMFHVADLRLEEDGGDPVSVQARVLVHDHRDQPVADLPLRLLFAGEIGGQNFVQDGRTGSDGWATVELTPYPRILGAEVAVSPAFLGSDDPAEPYFAGRGGDTPSYFYDSTRNTVHYRRIVLD